MDERPYCTYFHLLLDFISKVHHTVFVTHPSRSRGQTEIECVSLGPDNGTHKHSSLAFYPITL